MEEPVYIVSVDSTAKLMSLVEQLMERRVKLETASRGQGTLDPEIKEGLADLGYRVAGGTW